MANRLTQTAQNALNRSMYYAREMGHTYIGSEHILLGLLAEEDGVASRLLQRRGVTMERTRELIADFALHSGVGILLVFDVAAEILVRDLAIHVLNGGNAHFDARVAFAEQFDRIFSHVCLLFGDSLVRVFSVPRRERFKQNSRQKETKRRRKIRRLFVKRKI